MQLESKWIQFELNRKEFNLNQSGFILNQTIKDQPEPKRIQP